MSDKPEIFISHSSEDAAIVRQLKSLIEQTTDVVVFATSDSQAIQASEEWFQKIVAALDKAQALIVIVSPASKNSLWVNFEVGYFWRINEERKRVSQQKLPIYPLCFPNLKPYGALETIQGKSLNNSDDIQNFIQQLGEKFGDKRKLGNKLEWLNVITIFSSVISEILVTDAIVKAVAGKKTSEENNEAIP